MKANIKREGSFLFSTLVLFGLSSPAAAQVFPEFVQAAGNNPQLLNTANYTISTCLALVPQASSLTGDRADLLGRCAGAIFSATGGDKPGANLALDKITPQELIAQSAVVSGSVKGQMSAVASRVAAMGRFMSGPDMLSFRQLKGIQLADASGGDDAVSSSLGSQQRLQTFATGTYSGGHQDRSMLESGFKVDLASITAGADYRFSDKLVAGIAGGYGHTKLNFSGANGSLRSNAFTGSVYAAFQPTSRLDLSALFGYSRVRYTSARAVNYTILMDTVSRTIRGRTHGDQIELTGSGVYNVLDGAWIAGPAAQVSYTHLSIDRFDETAPAGMGGLNFRFPTQKSESCLIAVGFDVSKEIGTKGGIFSPYLRARMVYEALDNARAITIRFVNDPVANSAGSQLLTVGPDRYRFSLQGGVAAQFANGLSGFVDGQTLLGLRRVTQYALSVGLRVAL